MTNRPLATPYRFVLHTAAFVVFAYAITVSPSGGTLAFADNGNP